jgi:STE24 endopeptidase
VFSESFDSDPSGPTDHGQPTEQPSEEQTSEERAPRAQTPLPGDSAAMTASELAEAKRYGRQQLACALIDKGLDVAYLAAIAFFTAKPLDQWLGDTFPLLGRFASARLLVFLLMVTAGHVLVSFPLSCYAGYVLEHKFGLSNLRFRGWLWRYAKKLALTAAFSAIMFLGLFWIIWICGKAWWLVAAGAFFLVSVVLGQLVPVLILPMFYKIQPLDDAELSERIGALAEGTGLSVAGVYRLGLSQETVKANAMLAGLGRTRRVLLGDTLLDRFTQEEIQVIFAHEVGHHIYRHLRKMILAGIVYSAAGFWICDRLLACWVAHTGGPFRHASLPVYALPMVMLVLAVFFLVLEPLQNSISRRYERQADRYALERTANHEAYVSAFRKLARLNKDDPDPHWLEVALFHSHPPIAQRLALAEPAGSEEDAGMA